MEIQKTEERSVQEPVILSVQELKEQLFLATQKELEAIANEILALEEKYQVGIGIQIDAKKLGVFRKLCQFHLRIYNFFF